MAHIAVNFHYVGVPEYRYPGIHGFDTERFRAAVEGLARRHTIVSLVDVLADIRGETSLPENACVLTFDDGLRCQYEQALPVLDGLGLSGIFFVFACALMERRAAAVHRLHYLRATLGDAFISAAVERHASGTTRAGLSLDSVDARAARESYRYDSAESARLKYFLNYMAPGAFTETLTETLLLEIGLDEKDFVEMFYMDADMVRELGRRGCLGSHAVSHAPLAQMGNAAAHRELQVSRDFLETLSGRDIVALSYPLGNRDAVDSSVARMARACGYVTGWTMERACNRTSRDALLYARIDANDIDSLDRLECRARYFDEKQI